MPLARRPSPTDRWRAARRREGRRWGGALLRHAQRTAATLAAKERRVSPRRGGEERRGGAGAATRESGNLRASGQETRRALPLPPPGPRLPRRLRVPRGALPPARETD